MHIVVTMTCTCACTCTTSPSLPRNDYYSIGADGAFYGGGFLLLGKQAACSVATCTTSFSLTWLIGKVRLVGLHSDTERHLLLTKKGQHVASTH